VPTCCSKWLGAGVKVELLYAGTAQALDEVRSGRMDMLADPACSGAGNPRLHSSAVAGKRLSGVDAQGFDASIAQQTCTGQGALSEKPADPGIRTFASN
jgi:hypothetical protein